MKRIRVLHLSSAHPALDPRIVFKQCPALAESYEVICALPGARQENFTGFRAIRLPYFGRVIWRVLFTCPYALVRCIWLRPRLVHIYVPELLPFAFVFWLLGAKIVYEVQENLYKKMALKTPNRGYWLERAFYWFDGLACRYFYLIFTEHGYLTTYTRLSKPHAVIYNYPLLAQLEPFRQPYRPNRTAPAFLYIGLLSFNRAFDTLVAALDKLRHTYPALCMHLFGRTTFTKAELNQLPQFAAIRHTLRFYGYTDQREAFRQAANCTAGLALLKPVGDYTESYTTKLFEYMALGIPVITSDFPLYKTVVEQHGCGFCVSPYQPEQVANALCYLIEHPDEARQMGERGRRAVEQCYNWTTEARTLLNFYNHILQHNGSEHK